MGDELDPYAGGYQGEQADPGAYPGAATFGAGQVAVTVGALALHPTGHDSPIQSVGTELPVTNASGRELEAGELTLAVYAAPDTGEAERVAQRSFPLARFEVDETRTVSAQMELDAGGWTISATIIGADGAMLSDWVTDTTTVTGGPSPHHIDYDDSQHVDLTVQITHVVHEVGSMYRVHYVVGNQSSAARAGIPVLGTLSDTGGGYSEQVFELQEPLAHGTSRDHYLTLEALPRGETMSATISVDTGGQSEVSHTVSAFRDDQGDVTGLG